MTITPDILNLLIWVFAGLLAMNKIILFVLFRMVNSNKKNIIDHELFSSREYALKDDVKESYNLLMDKVDKLFDELHKMNRRRIHDE